MTYCPLCSNTGYIELWWPEMKVLLGVARCPLRSHKMRGDGDD